MNELIILIWWTFSPANTFQSDKYGSKRWHVEVSTSEQKFAETWNSLEPKEKENSRIFKGKEYVVLPVLNLVIKGKTATRLIHNDKEKRNPCSDEVGDYCSYMGEVEHTDVCWEKVGKHEGLKFCDRHYVHGVIIHEVQ